MEPCTRLEKKEVDGNPNQRLINTSKLSPIRLMISIAKIGYLNRVRTRGKRLVGIRSTGCDLQSEGVDLRTEISMRSPEKRSASPIRSRFFETDGSLRESRLLCNACSQCVSWTQMRARDTRATLTH